MGSGANRVYLNKDSNDNYYYNNYKIEVESYIDANGRTQYSAFFYATEQPQENSEKWYLNDISVVPNGDTFNFKDSSGNSISKDSNGNIYVNKADFNLSNRTNIVNTATGSPRSYTVTSEKNVLFFEGATKEQRELYDYALSLIHI